MSKSRFEGREVKFGRPPEPGSNLVSVKLDNETLTAAEMEKMLRVLQMPAVVQLVSQAMSALDDFSPG
jgi:hypothetical protein